MAIKIPVKERVIRKSDRAVESREARIYRIDRSDYVEQALMKRATDVVVANAFLPEDEFSNFYLGAETDKGIIMPPYDLRKLDRLAQENNALSPCIEAMVTNIDGTGFEFMKDKDIKQQSHMEEDDPKIKHLWDFFLECWPGQSFYTQRKNLRRDVERIGNGYIEVIRNAANEIVFMRYVDGKMMRIMALDDPVTVTKMVKRGGKEVAISVAARERRFVQSANGKTLLYFKDFGASRDLDKVTGKWAEPGQKIAAKRRASELIHFTCLPDAHTPYGVPRWIAQTPSVLGSRKAEEFNLDFFDNGGVPPVMILLHGGVLSHETRKALNQSTSGLAMKRNRVVVIEAEPTGGGIDNPSTAKITVERFGAERQQDSMFEQYDERAEQRVRRAFRLPPIFVGQAEDYSFATAYASYTVAEAQVFKPERDEFDEVMSIRVLPEMDFAGYRMRSLPMNIHEAALKLDGIKMADETNHVVPEEIIGALNETVGTKFKVTKEPVRAPIPIGGGIAPASGKRMLATPGASLAAQRKPKQNTTDKANATEARKSNGHDEDALDDFEAQDLETTEVLLGTASGQA